MRYCREGPRRSRDRTGATLGLLTVQPAALAASDGATMKTMTLSRSLKKSLSVLTLGLGLGLMGAASVHAQAVDGEVRKVDTDAGKITVRHGEIKNLDMPPMQMSFRVSDPTWLQAVQVGDKIRFTADKVNGQYTITSLEKR